ncbi:MAG: STAS domain-containing protein [Phycisphaerae bacterium]
MSINDYSDNIIVVKLPPEPKLRAELDKLMQVLQKGCSSDVIIDFSAVDIMTSLSLSGFLKVRELVSQANKKLIFCNAISITKDIFKVTCFEGIFEFADTVDDAVKIIEEFEHCHNRNN